MTLITILTLPATLSSLIENASRYLFIRIRKGHRERAIHKTDKSTGISDAQQK